MRNTKEDTQLTHGNSDDASSKGEQRRALLCTLGCLAGVALLALGQPISVLAEAVRDKDGLYIPQAQQQGRIAGSGASRQAVATFRLYNLSAHAMRIEAEADCSCSSLSWKQKTLDPWRWADLSAHMNLKPSGSGKASTNLALHISSSGGKLQQPARSLTLREPSA